MATNTDIKPELPSCSSETEQRNPAAAHADIATPLTDALLSRHQAEVADADKECLHELAVAQVRELIAHTRNLERDRARGARLARMVYDEGNIPWKEFEDKYGDAELAASAEALLRELGE